MPDLITLDDVEYLISPWAIADGVTVSERQMHCFFMALQSFSPSVVYEMLLDADWFDDIRPTPLTPAFLKRLAIDVRWKRALSGVDDVDREGRCQ